MTDEPRSRGPGDDRSDDPVLRLAERHAELVDGATRRAPAGSPEGDGDPGDVQVFAALDRVRADLAALGAAETTAPPRLLADLDRALGAERAAGGAPADGAAGHPTGPARRRLRLALAAAVLALLTVLVGAVAAVSGGTGSPPPTAQRPPVDVRPGDLPDALRAGLGRGGGASALDGPLADPARLAACLAAHDVAPAVRPAGVRRVRVDGTPGVVIVLPTGVVARFRVLVVGDGCSPATPLTLADGLVGR